MAQDSNTYPILLPFCEVIETDSGCVITERVSETYLFLTETQYDIISLSTGINSIKKIIKSISSKYGVEKTVVRRDIKKFFNFLLKKRYLTISPLKLSKPRLYTSHNAEIRRNISNIPTAYSRLCGLYLILTEKCPLTCSYCFMALESRKKDDLLTTIPFEEAKRLLREGRELGATTLIISGGELRGYRYSTKVISYAFDIGYKTVKTSTKGIGITKEFAESLFKAGIREMQVSIDAITNSTYKKLIPHGSVEAAINGILNLLESGIKLYVRSTLTCDNIKEIPDLWVFLRNLGVSATRGVVVTPEGRANLQMIPTEDEIKALKKEMKIRFDEERNYKTKGGTEKFEWKVIFYPVGDVLGCGGGIFTLAAYPDGSVTICDSGRELMRRHPKRFVFGNFKTQSLSEIWYKSKALNDFRVSKFSGKCASCRYVYDCLSGCPIHKDIVFESPDGASPMCLIAYPFNSNGTKRKLRSMYRWEKPLQALAK